MDTMSTGYVDSGTYNLDRKAASKLLKVSIRTLDRYIKSNRLSTRIIGGRVWLSKDDVKRIKARDLERISVDNGSVSISGESIDEGVVSVDGDSQNNSEVDHSVSTKRNRAGKIEDEIYKNLYLDLKLDLQEKQQRLELANYRVGQLENQLKNTVPLLQYHKEEFEHKKNLDLIQVELSEAKRLVQNMSSNLKYERLNKRIFVVVILTILALQPLWLIFNSFE